MVRFLLSNSGTLCRIWSQQVAWRIAQEGILMVVRIICAMEFLSLLNVRSSLPEINLTFRNRTLQTAALICMWLLAVLNLMFRWVAEAEPRVDTSFTVATALESSVPPWGIIAGTGATLTLLTGGCAGGPPCLMLPAVTVVAAGRCGKVCWLVAIATVLCCLYWMVCAWLVSVNTMTTFYVDLVLFLRRFLYYSGAEFIFCN